MGCERMLETGAWVVTRRDGVCRVHAAEGAIIAEPIERPGVRVTLAAEDIVRPVIGRAAAEEVVERVPYLRTIQAANDRAYGAAIQAALDAYDALQWVQVVKTVYMREKHGRARPDERLLAERARTYLHGELAAALGIPFGAVEAYIARSIAETE